MVTGAVAACTGMIMLSLWAVVRELKNIALQLGPGLATTSGAETPLRSAAASAALRDLAPESDGFPLGRDQPVLQAQAIPSRQRHHPRFLRRHGRTRPRRASARATSRRRRRRAEPRQPSSRGAICCFPRPRGRSASAPRRERPIRLRPIFASLRLPRRRRSNRASPHRRRRSTTPGRNRNARGPPMRRCSGAAAAHLRHLPSQRRRNRCRSPSAGCAKRGTAAGYGSQIGRRRWHGLFVIFGWLDRGANARRHDAVRLDRRTARAPRPASMSRPPLPANPLRKIRHRCSCHFGVNPLIF